MTEIYTVRKGNTLWGIARKYNTTLDKLLELNPHLKSRPNHIEVGWKINVPPKSAEDIDMNVKGLSVEKNNSGEKSSKSTRTPNTGRTQGSVNPTAKKVEGPKPKSNLLSTVDNKRKTQPPVPNDEASYALALKRVEYIIGKYNPNPAFEKSEYAKKIVDIANSVGIDPVEFAAIVKRESTFNPFSKTYKGIDRDKKVINGGPAGITKAPPKDMYQEHRFWQYDSKMAELKKQYGSLKNIFAAKDKNPEMDLGDFGEMLYKYKDNDGLKEACTEDYDVNLKVGAYYFKMVYKHAKPDPEHNKSKKEVAFDNYNIGTKGYGRDAKNIVDNANKQFS